MGQASGKLQDGACGDAQRGQESPREQEALILPTPRRQGLECQFLMGQQDILA